MEDMISYILYNRKGLIIHEASETVLLLLLIVCTVANQINSITENSKIHVRCKYGKIRSWYK